MPAPEPSRAQAVLHAIAALRGNAATQPSVPGQTLAAHRGDARQLITALRAAALILADVRESIALTLRQELQVETGLSLPMIEWGLVTSLSSLRHAPLAELAATRPANAPRELIGVILAGNVFVAAVRGIALPLLAGAHVIAKTSTREGALARAFHAALTQADKTIAARLAIVQFRREDEAATRALCTSVDALSVYGSDETVEQLRRLSATEPHSNARANRVVHGNAQTVNQPPPASATEHPHSNARANGVVHGNAQAINQPPPAAATEHPHANGVVHGNAQTINQPPPASAASPTCAPHESATSDDRAPSGRAPAFRTSGAPRIIAHGHGLSAAYVAQSVLQSSEQAAHAAERIALDIAAYDQRGCLSPHFVLVEPGATITPQAFAQLLAAQALPALAQLLPPGDATLDEQADRMQWQATAAVRGELYAHATHAVSFEPAPARPSPGGRLISVYACESQAQLRELLEPFAKHLKCLGVAGSKAERTSISDQLKAFCTAQVCRSGEMQTPAFDAWADGAPPLAGLFPA